MRARVATIIVIACLLAAATVASAQSAREAIDQLDRRVAGLLRVGQVYVIDHDRGRLQVSLGVATDGSEFLTGWLRWPDWMTPEVGQLALIACPSGNLHFATLVSLLPMPDDRSQ